MFPDVGPFLAETCCKQILIHIIKIFSFPGVFMLCESCCYWSVQTLGINAVIICKVMLSFIEFLCWLKKVALMYVYFCSEKEVVYWYCYCYILLRHKRIQEEVHAGSRMSRLVITLSGKMMRNIRYKTW
jgi:hypothetical protein